MELITRHIVRKKGDREIIYPFTTYDVLAFPKHGARTSINLERLIERVLQPVFMRGMKEAPGSPSAEKAVHCEIKHLKGHEFSRLANESAYYGQGARQHPIVQNHFMRCHPDAIAFEVPVFDEEFSGCIDLLLYDSGTERVSILDFKPHAKKEKHVSGQLFRYAKLLSGMTRIPMSQIDTYYFDGEDAYQITF